LLGQGQLDSEYRALAERVADATWARWGSYAVTTQTGSAVALQFQIVPESQRSAVGGALANLVRSAGGRVATGFLGTPLVLPALAAAGYFDEAYLMLFRREVPSWLYQVDQGATTIWERWDAIRPDGSIHPGTMTSPVEVPGANSDGHMLSFNHYAYGAVIDWVYRYVAGIAPDRRQPGYRRVVFAPKPAKGVDWARASVDTPYGNAAIAWQLDGDGKLSVDIELPSGTSGEFIVPATAESRIHVDGDPGTASVSLAPGHHSVTITHARVLAAAHDAEAAGSEAGASSAVLW